MEVWELAARECLRDVVARYNVAGDSGRLDAVLDLFTPDAVLDMDGEVLQGQAAIGDGLTAAGGDFVAYVRRSGAPRGGTVLRHSLTTQVLDVDGPDEARGFTCFLVLMAHGLDHWGTYTDRFVRQGDRWLFASRKVVVEGHVPGGFVDLRRSGALRG